MNYSLVKANRTFLALLLAALVSLPMSARAQSADDALLLSNHSPAVGARMLGMAGAGGIGGIADQAALLFNPAGLAYFDKSVAGGALSTLNATDNAVYTAAGQGETIENDMPNTGLFNLHYVYKAPTRRGSLVAAAAYNQVNTYERELMFEGRNANNSITDFFMPVAGEFDINLNDDGSYNPVIYRDLSYIAFQTYAIDFDPALYEAGQSVPFYPAVSRGDILQNGRLTETGSTKSLSFGGAAEAAENVMFGLSVNALFGSYNFDRVFEEEDDRNDNNGSAGSTDFDYLRLGESLESDITGLNVRAGVTSQVVPGLHVGLTVESPTFYKVTEDFRTTLETYFDNGDNYSYGSQADEDAGRFSNEYNLRTPWKFGAGANFNVANLMLAVDAEFIDWSQMEFDASGDASFYDDVNFGIRQDLNSVINTKVGGEYRVGDLFLRAGFAYQPDPHENTDFVDRSKTFLSAGFGYRVQEQFQIDFGWMQEQFEDEYYPYSNLDPALGNTPVIQEEITRNRFAVGVKVFF